MDKLSIGQNSGQALLNVGADRSLTSRQIGQTENTPGSSFADTLKGAIGTVDQLQKESDKAIQNLATGRTDNVADVMIATEKADIALKLMVQVRNKIIDAYQEIMKMQV